MDAFSLIKHNRDATVLALTGMCVVSVLQKLNQEPATVLVRRVFGHTLDASSVVGSVTSFEMGFDFSFCPLPQ